MQWWALGLSLIPELQAAWPLGLLGALGAVGLEHCWTWKPCRWNTASGHRPHWGVWTACFWFDCQLLLPSFSLPFHVFDLWPWYRNSPCLSLCSMRLSCSWMAHFSLPSIRTEGLTNLRLSGLTNNESPECHRNPAGRQYKEQRRNTTRARPLPPWRTHARMRACMHAPVHPPTQPSPTQPSPVQPSSTHPPHHPATHPSTHNAFHASIEKHTKKHPPTTRTGSDTKHMLYVPTCTSKGGLGDSQGCPASRRVCGLPNCRCFRISLLRRPCWLDTRILQLHLPGRNSESPPQRWWQPRGRVGTSASVAPTQHCGWGSASISVLAARCCMLPLEASA